MKVKQVKMAKKARTVKAVLISVKGTSKKLIAFFFFSIPSLFRLMLMRQ